MFYLPTPQNAKKKIHFTQDMRGNMKVNFFVQHAKQLTIYQTNIFNDFSSYMRLTIMPIPKYWFRKCVNKVVIVKKHWLSEHRAGEYSVKQALIY
jgi:hypothetical protein